MKSDIFYEKKLINEKLVDNNNIMDIPKMFDLIHSVADNSLHDIGLDKETIIKQRLLWVLGEQTAQIVRMPIYGDQITIKTWVGKEFALFIPRYYEIEDNAGNTIVRASSIWAIINQEERKTVIPSSAGITIPETITGNEINFINTPKSLPTENESTATVKKEYIDFNNHMNNAKYLEILNQKRKFIQNEKVPKLIIARYSKEAFLGDILNLKWGENSNSAFYSIDSNRGNHLKLRLDY